MRYVSYVINVCKEQARRVFENAFKESINIEFSINNILFFKLMMSSLMTIILIVLIMFLLFF